MQASFLCVIVFGNILVWLIEQFVDHNFEFLCISYILNECLLLFFYGMIKELERDRANSVAEKHSVIISTLNFEDKLTEEQIALVFDNFEEVGNLTRREKEILKHILFGEKRKEIAVNLYVSESAVRKHTTNIFRKLKVGSRAELFKKIKSLN